MTPHQETIQACRRACLCAFSFFLLLTPLTSIPAPALAQLSAPDAPSGVERAPSRRKPVLTGVEILRDDDRIRLSVNITGGAPEATLTRFTDGGRVMILEIAGVIDGAERRVIPVRDERLETIRIESLPGGVQLRFEAGDHPDPFAGHGLEPTLIPSGLGLTVWDATRSTAPVLPAGGLPYPVSEFELVYAQDHPDNPPVKDILQTPVSVGMAAQGYVTAREPLETRTFPISDVPPNSRFLPLGIRAVSEAIVAAFNARGLAGVFVQPHPDDIDPDSSRDKRRGRTKLRMLVWTGRLLEYRTFASGTRLDEDESIDNKVHARIKSESPVQPGGLIRKDEIDAYVARMNRHPGRRIDTSLTAAGEPGGAYLDYLVNDSRPWAAYAQVSNTGTDGTGDLRTRFGFTHYQLTNRDDILQLDYITGEFDETINAVFGSYDVPLFWDNRVRLSVGGSWVQYDAEQLGAVNVRFQGDLWSVDGKLTGTVFQHDDWFVDVFTGIEWESLSVDNRIAGFPLGGDADFFMPSLGALVEHRRPEITVLGRVWNVWSASSASGVEDEDYRALGRDNADDPDFEILKWDVSTSIFADAFVALSQGADTDKPLPLAHEFYFQTRGQYAWDNRLAPQFQDVSTGYYAVRGYNQSIAAGDDLLLGRIEYRLHIPRLLPVRPFPLDLFGLDFKAQPAQPNGLPDWDLIVRAFYDVGYTRINDATNVEFNETLMGAGGGLEFRFMRYLVLSADLGVALRDADNGEAEKGDYEFHLVGTVIF